MPRFASMSAQRALVPGATSELSSGLFETEGSDRTHGWDKMTYYDHFIDQLRILAALKDIPAADRVLDAFRRSTHQLRFAAREAARPASARNR